MLAWLKLFERKKATVNFRTTLETTLELIGVPKNSHKLQKNNCARVLSDKAARIL